MWGGRPFPTVCQWLLISQVRVIGKCGQMIASLGLGVSRWGNSKYFLPQWWAGFLSPSHIGLHVLPISTFWFGTFQFIGKISISRCLPFRLEPDLSPWCIKKILFDRIPLIMSPSGFKCTLKKGAEKIFQTGGGWWEGSSLPPTLPHVIDRTVILVSDILSFHMVLRWFSR